MSNLAIDGGKAVFPQGFAFEYAWPPVYPETAEKIRDLYLSHAWSYYGKEELIFDDEFAAYHNAKYGTFMCNGTVTLECALAAVGVGPGDEVIVPAYTWMATAAAAVYLGATPVFVDSEPDTFCMSPEAFEAAITPRTKAVVPVHLFGSIADMDKIVAIARKHGLKIVEDCAHAHGGKWNGQGVGSLGDVGSFSFQQSKIMTSGEGGICITNDPKYHDIVGRCSHIGYQHYAPGTPRTLPPVNLVCHNYRGTEFQAIILRDQLRHLPEDTARREQAAEYLRAALDKIPGVKVQSRGRRATAQNFYVYAVTIDPQVLREGKTKADVISALNAEGACEIFAGWGQPVFKHPNWSMGPEHYRVASSAVAEDIIYNKIVLLDIRWLMSDKATLDLLIEAFRKVMAEYSK